MLERFQIVMGSRERDDSELCADVVVVADRTKQLETIGDRNISFFFCFFD